MRVVAGSTYLAAAIGTGLQQLWRMMWSVWGAPLSPLQYVGLLGSLVMFGGAALTMIGSRRGHPITLGGAGLAFVFYVPALWTTFGQVLQRPEVLSREPWLWLPTVLLVAAVGFALRTCGRVPVLGRLRGGSQSRRGGSDN